MRFVIVLIMLLCVGCCYGQSPMAKAPDPTSKEASRCVNKILGAATKQFAKRYKMRAIGDSAAMFQNNVRKLGLLLQLEGPLTQDQLRPILVDCTNELLSLINSNERLRPYLVDYPFTAKNIYLSLFLVDQRGYYLCPPYIGVAKIREGELIYELMDDEPGSPIVVLAREPFDDAVRLVVQQ